jgi:hypothetical protein
LTLAIWTSEVEAGGDGRVAGGVVVRAVIVYESMFGSTRVIAEAIAEGFGVEADVRMFGVADADPKVIEDVDLLVVGGPTQAWGMSWPSTRRGARLHVNKPGSGLALEPGADTGPGVREWLATVGQVHSLAAAFDTRIKSPVLLTGRASKGISRELVRHGLSVVVPPESFFVDKKSHLLAGESDRARGWGKQLVTTLECLRTPKPSS